MRAVADAGPLIHLSWIEHVTLLVELFEEILIPTAVRDEVLAAPDGTPGLATIKKALSDRRFQIVDLSLPYSDDLQNLDAGEQAALLLADEVSAEIMLSDDALARAEANRRGLDVVGTVGILVKARDEGLLPAAFPLLLELRRRGQWLSDELLQAVLNQEATAP